MTSILNQKFFNRPAVAVAKDLLGKYLCRLPAGRQGGNRKKTICRMITETEAYDGPKDRASHASRGRTPRNEVMFGQAGNIYVHMVYGMYYCFNIVCGKIDYPAAVLIRGIEGVSGPGRICKFLKIDKKLNTKPANRKTGLWIENRGVRVKESEIKKSRRIGVDYAGPLWSNKLYRFYLKS